MTDIELFNMYLEAQKNAREVINKYTCQLLDYKNEYEVQAHGTGVFVEVENMKFMLTAAHVHEECINDLCFLINDNSVQTPGGKLYFNETDDRKKDNIDLAFYHLNDETLQKIGNQYSFYKLNNETLNHKYENLLTYKMWGFPICETIYTLNEVKMIPYDFMTLPVNFSNENFNSDEIKYNNTVNILLEYDREKVRNYNDNSLCRLDQVPSLTGMSGCGVWHIPIKNVNNLEEPKVELVGIMHTWDTDKKLVAGTKIDLFCEKILSKCL